MPDKDKQPGPPSLLQVIGSVLAAAFGVQSDANRKRDFTKGSATTYIVAGLAFTALFIAALIGVVKLIVG